ncbi:MAG: T9SS C-terminal target domain-containing protein [Crocinitomicaceae bacterium]|nr:T9SS C-terminal target domain-containing protein [Crocinitomicaceae bacterium]
MKIRLLLTCFCFSMLGFGQTFQDAINHQNSNYQQKSSGCAPSAGKTILELNNVRALIHTGGNLWQITSENRAQYEVPKGSGIMALFTSALWLGGTDVNDQLKLAALRYLDGRDYWTGPLTVDGTAEITAEECSKYDRHFVITKDEVSQFDAWFKAGEYDAQNGTNTQTEKFPNYAIPESILDWPAHGNISIDQDYYLAPFYDRNQDGNYNPYDGDYPWYDLEGDIECNNDRTLTLYGDQTYWWVMNDKGNIHTETSSEPIGMEIKAQAFAFSSNDAVNDMTFYNYELINRSTQTLTNTYFGVFVDVALGGPFDDYVGCDVSRGLAYAYNGRANDISEQGFLGYGTNPPAIGVDFFEGPYQDNDGIDNAYGIGPGEALNGIGYGDGIVDNERYGMRRFVYYNNIGVGNSAQTDPTTAQQYYYYLQGIWKDGTQMVYGGSGHVSDALANPNQPAYFMFPDDSDPLAWGTNGIPQNVWNEQTAGNLPYDRRFVQSAGPFTLLPGAVNNITVGVAYARASGGDPFESVQALKLADDKAQSLFENCFKILEGPHAPQMEITELENELIFTLYNPLGSNNENEEYEEIDPFIITTDSSAGDNKFRFQGYMVYQLVDNSVSLSDLDNTDKARLVFQCDVQDGISRLINYEFNQEIGVTSPVLKVDGADEGLAHSFSIKTDQFATGANSLVNFKKYYYLAVAYAHNEFDEYDPEDPTKLGGQKEPFLVSRKSAFGPIETLEGIPHNPMANGHGTSVNSYYGQMPEITRVDGKGNGGNFLDLTEQSIEDILYNNFSQRITYKENYGPVTIKVIDPLAVLPADYRLEFLSDSNNTLQQSDWQLINLNSGDTIFSDQSIDVRNEQIIPELGISITINQLRYQRDTLSVNGWFTEPIATTITYEDSSKMWLSGVFDVDANNPNNWIRSGTNLPGQGDCPSGPDITNYFDPCCYFDRDGVDPDKKYQDMLNGSIAPFKLVGYECVGMPFSESSLIPSAQGLFSFCSISYNDDINIVITNDNNKWTKCPVIETCKDQNQSIGGVEPMSLRQSTSKDRDGNEISGSIGYSYFPGYAININTGERLNMAFGENSGLYTGADKGRDMLWNPTKTYYNSNGYPIFGGQHPIYIFRKSDDPTGMPIYDEGQFIHTNLNGGNILNYRNVWKECVYVYYPLLAQGRVLLESNAIIKIRTKKPYEEFIATGERNGLPTYEFSTKGINVINEDRPSLIDNMSNIYIVPNPYYGHSSYEQGALEYVAKITNLPQECEIGIYNIRGKLVHTFKKDNSLTFLDWDLTNHIGVPIASGVYLIHIKVPDGGEKILKFFVAMRQVDTEQF